MSHNQRRMLIRQMVNPRTHQVQTIFSLHPTCNHLDADNYIESLSELLNAADIHSFWSYDADRLKVDLPGMWVKVVQCMAEDQRSG